MMSDEKTCPYCAETIKAAAIKCRYCGEMLTESEADEPQAESIASTAKDPTLDYFLPGFVTVIGIGLFFYGASMDLTVSTGNSMIPRVANIHLMAQQRNYQMSGAFITVLGILYALYVNQNPPKKEERSSSTGLTALRGTAWWDELPKVKQQAFLLALVFLIGVCVITVIGSAM